MNWILCYLNPYDDVIYKSDTTETTQNVKYYEFIKYVRPYIKDNYKDFLDNLNRYFTLYINTLECTWEIYRKKFKEPTFEELYTLNAQRENNKGKQDSIQLYKNMINNVSNKKYDRQNGNESIGGKNIQSFFSGFKRKS